MSKVLVPLANGFEEIEAITVIDVLRRAGIEVQTASINEKKEVVGAHNITVLADFYLSEIDIDSLDMIILPGGWGGTVALKNDKNIEKILKEMDKKGKNIGAICAAPLVLHNASVLKHDYTCYPSIEKQIREDGFSDTKMIIEDGNIITSRGPATAICFALFIVKKLKGEHICNNLKSALLADYCD